MIDFVKRNLTFLVITAVTLAVIVGGVFLMSGNKTEEETPKKVDSTLLTPDDSYVTSGIKDGKYLPKVEGAKVTVVEFGDFECPACASYDELTQQMLKDFAGQVNYYFRHFPLPQHKKANITSYAAESAGMQGKFWEMHHMLYLRQSEWSASDNINDKINEYADALELDKDKFVKELSNEDIKKKVSRDLGDGSAIGVNSTPSFFVNGVKIANPRTYDEFKKIIEDAKNTNVNASDEQAFHTHFDIKTYIDGVAVNFSEKKYQESKDNPLSPDIHFHDGNGKSAHIHKEGSTLKTLLESVKITFPTDTEAKTLKVYVNGKLQNTKLEYAPQDLDRILISFGPVNDTNIQQQINSVTDVACIYSEKCPERGTPPPEGCVGGLGTDCEI